MQLKMVQRIGLLVAVMALAACAGITSNVYQSPAAMSPPIDASVVILPSDVVIAEYTAGGDQKPRADWSEEVITNLNDAVHEFLYEAGVRFVPYDGALKDEHVGFIRQSNVILDALQLSQEAGVLGSGDRDYRIGQHELDSLRSFDTDYAVIVTLRSNRATTGRQITAVLGALAGAYIETSNAQFRSALIDLRDGQIKWANFDSQALSDIGDVLKASPEKWEKSVAHLMSEFPL